MTPLEQLILAELPAIIGFFQVLFHKANPDLPIPTSEQIVAAYESGYLSSIAKDEAIKAAHPPL